MNIMKRLLSITLALLMITAVLPTGIVAEVPDGWTVTASNTGYGDSVDYMFDSDTATRWSSGSAIGYRDEEGHSDNLEKANITVDFGTSKTIKSIRLLSNGDYAIEYTVSTSSDNSTWTVVKTVTDGSVDSDGYQTISFDTAIETQYLKIECTKSSANWSYWSIYELEIVESKGWTAEVSSTGYGDSANYMFDGNTGTRWSNGSDGSSWVIVDFGKTTEVFSVSLLSKDSDYAEGYVISYSDDNSNWTEILKNESDGASLMSGDYQIFDLGQTVSCQYLKIECTKTSSAGSGYHWWSIYELEINVETSSGSSEGKSSWSASVDVGYNPERMYDDVYTIGDEFRWTSYKTIGYEELSSASVTLNLGSVQDVSSIRLLSNNDYALEYTVYSSTNGTDWETVISATDGSATNGYQIINLSSTVSTQYIKITCTKSASQYNWWSIYEIDINTTDVGQEPVFYGWALTLDGRIGLTYYFDMTDVADADSYTLTSNVGTVVKGESKTDGTGNTTEYYRYTVYVSVADINTTIQATLSNGEISVTADEYSVAAYCSTAIESEAAEKDLCQALLTYGYYTGEYIEGKSTGITGYTDVSGNTVTIDSSKFGNTETAGYAKTLILDDVVSIRVYMTSDKCEANSTFKVGSNVLTPTADEITVGEVTYSYYIEFDVSAQNLDTMFDICDENGTILTKYSVYSYIMNQLADGSGASDSLKNLCKAIYMYGEAANSYNGWH